MVILFLAGLLLIIYSSLFLYYRHGWNSMPIFYTSSSAKPIVFISVIISARNEEMNLPTLLKGLKGQSYPSANFEVIVVDDHSADETSEIVEAFSMTNLKLIYLKDFVSPGINSYKKKAIEVAIGQSRGELIVTTDADCVVPDTWLHTIAAFYEEKKPSLIVMPVSINCSNKLLEIFQALDFMTLQGITGAAVQKNIHSMCNGANLSYTRKAFDTVEGFKGIDNIASGDDMLLMHKIYKHYPGGVHYLKSGDVIVHTAPMYTIKEFINQRIRWASKADKYDDQRILPVLVVVYLFNVLLFMLPFVAIFRNEYSISDYTFSLMGVWGIMVLVKAFFELAFLFPVAKFFNKQSLLFIFPLLQPFHILYTVIAGWLGKFGSYRWKGRKVK